MMIDIERCNRRPIYIGEQGENCAEIMQFDLRNWQRKWADGTVSLLVKLSKDELPYTTTTTYANGILTWQPTSTDTRYAGRGKIEIQLRENDVLVKSAVLEIEVGRSLDNPTDIPPSPIISWLDTLLVEANQLEKVIGDATKILDQIDEIKDIVNIDKTLIEHDGRITANTASINELTRQLASKTAIINDTLNQLSDQILTVSSRLLTEKQERENDVSALSSSIASANSAISAEAAARTNADKALSDRIDNLVLEAGGSDITEVVDARTGTDGTVYTTLKARLDADLAKYAAGTVAYDADGGYIVFRN